MKLVCHHVSGHAGAFAIFGPENRTFGVRAHKTQSSRQCVLLLMKILRQVTSDLLDHRPLVTWASNVIISARTIEAAVNSASIVEIDTLPFLRVNHTTGMLPISIYPQWRIYGRSYLQQSLHRYIPPG